MKVLEKKSSNVLSMFFQPQLELDRARTGNVRLELVGYSYTITLSPETGSDLLYQPPFGLRNREEDISDEEYLDDDEDHEYPGTKE